MHKTIIWLENTTCPRCGRAGKRVAGNYSEWYNITGERYVDYVRDLVGQGVNVVDPQLFVCGGCSECDEIPEEVE